MIITWRTLKCRPNARDGEFQVGTRKIIDFEGEPQVMMVPSQVGELPQGMRIGRSKKKMEWYRGVGLESNLSLFAG